MTRYVSKNMILSFVALTVLVGASDDVVRQHVTDGIRKYKSGDYRAAAKEFADADLLKPADHRIAFNRGCAESRSDNRPGARKFFKSAAMAKDSQLAAAAHYNLGCLEAKEARSVFDGPAEDATGSVRKQGVTALNRSIDHYRDCLNIDPNHTKAKRNLEIIRLFLAEMQKKWEERDKENPGQNQEQEEPLARFLSKLDGLQHGAYESLFSNPSADGIRAVSQLQVKVNDRIPELREKIETALAAPQQANNMQVEQVRLVFETQCEEFEEHTTAALKSLANEEAESAAEAQLEALARVNRMYETVADFPELVQRSLRVQSHNNGLSNAVANMLKRGRIEVSQARGDVVHEREMRIASVATILLKKAEQLERTLDVQGQQSGVQGGSGGGGMQQPPMDQKTITGLRTAIDRARELTPELIDVSTTATALLAEDKIGESLDKQARAVEILERIAETLPKQKNGQSDNNDEQEGQEPPNEDEASTDEDRGESSEQQQERKQEEQQEIRNREEAEAMLRQVRDREQNLREVKAQLRARARRARVDRDW